MTYLLNIALLSPQPVLKLRPWWKFWGHDSIVMIPEWQNVKLSGLSQKQADEVLAMHADPELSELLVAIACRGTDQTGDIVLFQESSGKVLQASVMDTKPTFMPWNPKA